MVERNLPPLCPAGNCGVYVAWIEPRKYQLLSDFVAGSQSSAWSHMGLEEPVMGIGNNFVGVPGKDEACPLLGGFTILPTVGFKYKNTSQWKTCFKQEAPEKSIQLPIPIPS